MNQKKIKNNRFDEISSKINFPPLLATDMQTHSCILCIIHKDPKNCIQLYN